MGQTIANAVSLQGPAGPSGPPGPAGATGPPGSQGPEGRPIFWKINMNGSITCNSFCNGNSADWGTQSTCAFGVNNANRTIVGCDQNFGATNMNISCGCYKP